LGLCQLLQEDSTDSWWLSTSSPSGSKSSRPLVQRLTEYSTCWMSSCIATGCTIASSQTCVPTSTTSSFGSIARTAGSISGTSQSPTTAPTDKLNAPTGWYSTPSRRDCATQLSPKEASGSRNYRAHSGSVVLNLPSQ
jgi:hypothetical protein